MPPSKQKHVLVRLRQHLGLSQKQLAAWCACSEVTIQSIEVGRLALSKNLALRISRATAVPAEWLLANDLKSPLPKLALKPLANDAFLNTRLSRTLLFVSVFEVLKLLEAIQKTHSEELLRLVDHYTA